MATSKYRHLIVFFLALFAISLAGTATAESPDRIPEVNARSLPSDTIEQQASDALGRIQTAVKALEAAVSAEKDPTIQQCYSRNLASAQSFMDIARQSRHALLRAIDRDKPMAKQRHLLKMLSLAEQSVEKITKGASVCRPEGEAAFAGASATLREGGSTLQPSATPTLARTPKEIQKVFVAKDRHIKRCHQMIAQSFGETHGTFTVAVDLDTRGRVTAVHPIQNDHHSLFAQCASDRILSWQFPPQRTDVRVKHAWTF